MPAPVRVKVWGLLPLTRRSYVVLQMLTLAVGLAVIAVGFWWPRPKLLAGVAVTPLQRTLLWLLDALPWLGLLFLAIEGLETALVLRQFARKEKEQQAPPA